MAEPADFFAPWEPDPVASIGDFLDLVERTFSRWQRTDTHYAWRGVINADWPLHSALYRRMVATYPSRKEEAPLARLEGEILAEAHRWGLHYVDRAHLPILYELAMLQHFGAPTRLIDITFNPLVALYFAVEDQRDDSAEVSHSDKDGRLFVFDVSSRLINERSTEERQWEEAFARPWTAQNGAPSDWQTSAWAWRPAPIEARFAAQMGGFLFGGVPATGGGRWPRGPAKGSGMWPIADVRASTSVAVRFHKLQQGGGRPPDNPSFTVRVQSQAKPTIREDLRRWFGIEPRTVYPDHQGFAMRGLPELKQ